MPHRSLSGLAAVAFLVACWGSSTFLRPIYPTLGALPARPLAYGHVFRHDEHGHDARIGLQQQALSLGQTLSATCLGPTLLGLWRSEYGVSYGYGSAVALSAYLLWRDAAGLAAVHLFCLVLYGVRLNLFLLWRELCIPRFREMRNRIEERAVQQGGRLNRLPFIVTCALLYLGLVAPGVLVFKASVRGAQFGSGFRLALLGMYVGWGVAAFGDLYKSVVKAKEGKDAIVTGGPYALLRHPNYTGEQLLWSANFVAGLLAAATLHPVARSRHTKHLLQGLHGFHVLQSPKAILLTWLPLSALGLLGIIFVLMQATAGLEKRQREKYGEEEKYRSWFRKTWPGLALRSPRVTPESSI